jgi:hypothetical protein
MLIYVVLAAIFNDLGYMFQLIAMFVVKVLFLMIIQFYNLMHLTLRATTTVV